MDKEDDFLGIISRKGVVIKQIVLPVVWKLTKKGLCTLYTGNFMHFMFIGLFKLITFAEKSSFYFTVSYRVSHETWQLVNSLKCLLP